MTATVKRIEAGCQRQIRLGGIPAAGTLLGGCLPPINLHSEALETERLRTADHWVVVLLVSEPVARLVRLTRGAHPRSLAGTSMHRVASNCGRPLIERELLNGVFIVTCVSSHLPLLCLRHTAYYQWMRCNYRSSLLSSVSLVSIDSESTNTM